MRILVVGSCTLLLAACAGHHPKPPTVSGTHRVPVNSAATAAELKRSVFPPPPPAPVERHVKPAAPQLPASQTVTVHFPWNGWTFHPDSTEAAELHKLLAIGVDHINVRGRTDNSRPSAGDRTVARNRALVARDWLIGQGVPAGKISVNFVSASDYVANNRTKHGRALNRRVDIQIFRK